MESILKAQGYMFTKVVEENLTGGQAIDKCVKEGKKVARAIWKGYWVMADVATFSKPCIVAILGNNAGVAPASPYQEDLMAADWMVVE